MFMLNHRLRIQLIVCHGNVNRLINRLPPIAMCICILVVINLWLPRHDFPLNRGIFMGYFTGEIVRLPIPVFNFIQVTGGTPRTGERNSKGSETFSLRW